MNHQKKNKFKIASGGILIAAMLVSGLTTPAEAAKKTKAKTSKTSFTTTEVTEAFYDKAWRNFQIGSKKERQEVISALKAIVKKNAEEFMAHYYLGIMMTEEESTAAALKHLETALLGFPKSADIHVRIAKILTEKNKSDEALEHYREAIKLDPNNGPALSEVGIAEMEMGNNDLAFELLFKARQAQPDNVMTLRGLGAVMIERSENAEAAKILEQALLFDPKHADTHWLLAKAYENLQKPDKASEHYELARKLGRKDPEIKQMIGYDLARSLVKSGKYEEAEKEYKKAIGISDDKATGFSELANLYLDIGREDNAIDNFKKAYELDSQKGEGILAAAELYMKREDFDNALGLYEVLKKNKAFADQAKNAIKELEERRQIDEKLALEAKIEDGKADPATEEITYLEILESNPKDEETLKNLWEFYEERGYYDEAIKYFRAYNKSQPVSDFQKKLIEKELKNKRKLDNYTIFGWKDPIDYKNVTTSEEDLKQQAFNGENDRLKELAFDILAWRIGHYAKERSMGDDKPILEARVAFYEERGKVEEAVKTINALKRYGWWTADEASDKKKQIKDRFKK
ncbi:MAG: tetratricopeptide repeat protein [Candidatus Riflebacteria bacterium]